MSHDWGGALGWIFAHRYSHLIRRLAVVNCPHPKTLVRAVLHFEDFQTIRIPWVPIFEIPWLPDKPTERSGASSALPSANWTGPLGPSHRVVPVQVVVVVAGMRACGPRGFPRRYHAIHATATPVRPRHLTCCVVRDDDTQGS